MVSNYLKLSRTESTEQMLTAVSKGAKIRVFSDFLILVGDTGFAPAVLDSAKKQGLLDQNDALTEKGSAYARRLAPRNRLHLSAGTEESGARA